MNRVLAAAGIVFVLYGALITSPLRFLAPGWAQYPYVAFVLLISGAFMLAIGGVVITSVGTAVREGTFWTQLRGFWWIFAGVIVIAASRVMV
ncbi:MAG: hypothetical protein AB7E70_20190 [Hyphomicrobiaceae bacterium]